MNEEVRAQIRKQIDEIHQQASQKLPAQIVIDLIELTYELFYTDDKVERDDVACIAYDIENVLQVLNPQLAYEAQLLGNLLHTIDAWESAIELEEVTNK